ncbi:MFS transporter [Paenibacillus marinisediminis]
MRKVGDGVNSRLFFLVIVFMFWFSSYIYVPVLGPYIEHLGASYTLVGMVLGVYGLMQILFRMPIGIGSDYWNRRKPFILLGLVATLVSCIMFAWSDQLGWAFAARAVSGIAASAWVVYAVMFSGYYPQEDAGKAMSLMQFTTVLAQLVSMMISGAIVERWGWQMPFIVGGVVSALAIVLALRLPEQRVERAGGSMSLKDLVPVMKEPMLLKVSILSVMAHCVLFITMFGYTPNQAIAIGASPESLGWLTIAFMAPHAAATLFAARLAGRTLGDRAALMLGFGGSALFTLLIPAAPTLGWLCATQALNGFAQGLLFPLLLGKSVEGIEPAKRATAMGVYQAVYAIGMSSGPWLAGWISSQYGLAGGFRFGAAAALCAAILAFFWIGRRETSGKSRTTRKGEVSV